MRRPEQAIQRAAMRYLGLLEIQGRLLAFHVGNGGYRRRTEAAILKGLGVRAGVADIVIVLPGGRVGFIELKAPGGRLSEAQRGFRDSVRDLGAVWGICSSVDSVQDLVQRWVR